MEHVLGNADYVKLILQYLRTYRDRHAVGRVCRLFRAIMEEKHIYRFQLDIQRYMCIHNQFPFKGSIPFGYRVDVRFTEQMVDIIDELTSEGVFYRHELVRWAIYNGNMRYLQICATAFPDCLLVDNPHPNNYVVFKYVIDELEKLSKQPSKLSSATHAMYKFITNARHREFVEYIAGKDLVPKHTENLIRTFPHIGLMSVKEFVEGLNVGDFDLRETLELAFNKRHYELIAQLIKLDKVNPEDFFGNVKLANQ